MIWLFMSAWAAPTVVLDLSDNVRPEKTSDKAGVAQASKVVAELCGKGKSPSEPETYLGTFVKGPGGQRLHVASCEPVHPRWPEPQFVVTADDKVLASGPFQGKSTVFIERIHDFDGDGRSEVILSGGGMYQGQMVVGANLVHFTKNKVEAVADFGLVWADQWENPKAKGCHERIAIILMDGTDLKRLRRRDYAKKCGAGKYTIDLGEQKLDQRF